MERKNRGLLAKEKKRPHQINSFKKNCWLKRKKTMEVQKQLIFER